MKNSKHIMGLIFFILFLYLIYTVSNGDTNTPDSSNNSNQSQIENNRDSDNVTENTIQEVEPVIDIKNLANKSIFVLSKQLGEPTSNTKEKLPYFSHIEWDTPKVYLLVDYKAKEEKLKGGLLTLKEITCNNQLESISKEKLEKSVKSIGIDYSADKWSKAYRHWEGYNMGGWGSILVKCDGTNVYFNFGTSDYLEWASE